jgi:predicted pyridoxine 5'-phosphate oxidase superfamily flavin-nucleotide-binding protein
MGKVYDEIDDRLAAWIAKQPLFFVGTAPAGDHGHVNVSPKGLDTLVILDPTTVAYLDLTGSGIETVAHVRDNGRVCVMLCAFEGAPRILRLQGRGEVVEPSHPDFDDLVGRFPPYPGVRSVIRVHCDRIADSCGYAVPLMSYAGERRALLDWFGRKEPGELDDYRAKKNAVSIDGLPGLSG